MCCSPFAPIQILTGDTRKPCGSRRGRLHDERWSLQRKLCIERRFESSPESRGSQTSGVLLVLFVQAKRIKPFPLPGTSRFCKPRFSSLKHQFRTNKIKSFLELSCLLETWSPCSRPFAILPVSAVSDAQKLATGNFLHVRAESLSLPGRHALRAFRRHAAASLRLRRFLGSFAAFSAALPPFTRSGKRNV